MGKGFQKEGSDEVGLEFACLCPFHLFLDLLELGKIEGSVCQGFFCQ
jgi:hypothetical protein